MKRTFGFILTLILLGSAWATDLEADLSNPTLQEYHYLGEFYLHLGQYETAIRNYEELARKYPATRQAEKAWMSIGSAYVDLLEETIRKAGATSPTAESYRRKAFNAYRKVADNFPDSAGLALIRIGKVYAFYSPGEEDLGRVKFREVMEDYPEEAGRAALFLGDSYFRREKYEQAKTAYRQARIFYPEVAAQAQVLYSRVDMAQKVYSSVVDDLTPVLNTLGIDGYFSGYRYHGNIMEEAISLTSESMEAKGNRRFVVDHLKSIIDQYPDTNIALRAQLRLAKTYSEQGKNDPARQELQRMIFRHPKSRYAALAYLAEAAIVPAADAIKVYENLRKAFPRSKFWVKASTSLAGKSLELAREASDAAVKKEHLDRARTAFKKIIDNYPTSPEAVQARALLKSNKL